MQPRYYIYAGLRIASEIPLPEWAPFEQPAPMGDPDVVISLGEDPNPGTSFDAPRVVTPRECRFAVPNVGYFRIIDGHEIIVMQAPGATPAQLRPWLIGSAWGSLCYQRGLFLLHASAVMVGDEAVLFCAPPKGGKSTMAAQLNACGYALVSDDLCHLDIPARGAPTVHPSTPRLKLWSDTLQELGWNTSHLEADQAREGKFHVARIANTCAVAAPLRAIYLLEWGKFGIGRLVGLTALRRFLSASTYRPGLLGSVEQLSRYSNQSLTVLQRVPLWELRRPRNLSANGKTLELLASHWSVHRMINQ